MKMKFKITPSMIKEIPFRSLNLNHPACSDIEVLYNPASKTQT